MIDKELNKAICKKLQKVAASYFNEVSDNLKGIGDSFTTYELCKLSRNKPVLFGIYTDITEVKTVDFWGNESSGKHMQLLTGKKETVCVGDFKCTFDLSNVFELLHKFEKLSGAKKMTFVIEEEKPQTITAKVPERNSIPESARNVIYIKCEPEDVPDYLDYLDSVPVSETATSTPVCLDLPAAIEYEQKAVISAVERPLCVLSPEQRHQILLVTRHFLITSKGMYYLIA